MIFNLPKLFPSNARSASKEPACFTPVTVATTVVSFFMGTGAGILALDLRLDRASLDDAFVALVREDEITTTSHEEIYS